MIDNGPWRKRLTKNKSDSDHNRFHDAPEHRGRFDNGQWEGKFDNAPESSRRVDNGLKGEVFDNAPKHSGKLYDGKRGDKIDNTPEPSRKVDNEVREEMFDNAPEYRGRFDDGKGEDSIDNAPEHSRRFDNGARGETFDNVPELRRIHNSKVWRERTCNMLMEKGGESDNATENRGGFYDATEPKRDLYEARKLGGVIYEATEPERRLPDATQPGEDLHDNEPCGGICDNITRGKKFDNGLHRGKFDKMGTNGEFHDNVPESKRTDTSGHMRGELDAENTRKRKCRGEYNTPVKVGRFDNAPSCRKLDNGKEMSNQNRTEGEYSKEDSSVNTKAASRLSKTPELSENNGCSKIMGNNKSNQKLYMIGFDAVALYPSMKEQNTARICREQLVDIVKGGDMTIQGIDIEKVTMYIRINRKMTSNIGKLWKYLPYRKKKGGVEPGMNSRGVKQNNEDNDQWIWPKREVPEADRTELIGIMLEIGVRIMFRNLIYSFGGEYYLQTEGGPIGIRGTGAVSKLVTRDFCQKLKRVLEEGGIEVKMLKMYVDDGRLVLTYVEKGAIYNPMSKKIEYTEDQKKIDTDKEREGETVDQRIKRLIIPIMNDINKDLEWTVELEEDFKDDILEGREKGVKRGIPTLDFEVYWEDKEDRFNYRYFEKKMRNPVVIQKRSAMDRTQKIGILSQELIRRLNNVSEGRKETEERRAVVEGYTKQLKQSGYNFGETQEVIRSGYTGLVRKRKRRKELGLPMHREGVKTLVTRTRKKILDKKMWYRREKEKEENERKKVRRQKGEEAHWRKTEKKTVEVKSVVFIQQTKDSRLVRRLREVEERLGETTGYRVKFVEKVGEKLVDLLCQSNPWKGKNCMRGDCVLCETKEETGKGKRQCCSSRNVTYETWSGTCEDRERERIEKEAEGEENGDNEKDQTV